MKKDRMSRPKKRGAKRRSRSGPTLPQSERGAKVYSISLPDSTRALWDRFAMRHGCTRSAVIVMALGALVQVEGPPPDTERNT